MKTFTGWQWLLIDLANHFGHDKMLFEERIKWSENNLNILETLADKAETKPLYIKAGMAIRKAQQGIPTGHMVGIDACCSGIQVMSVLTGCLAGATATGLVDPNVRADAYALATKVMGDVLGHGVAVSRDDAKRCLMTSFYGSKLVPKAVFGEETPELTAFYHAAYQVAPGAWELLQDLLASWKPYALSHAWKLPDGFDARIKVMVKREVRIEVDELNHATFSYEFYENQGSRFGLSNVANLTHSMDAYILREMHRKCNYDQDLIQEAALAIEIELIERSLGKQRDQDCLGMFGEYVHPVEYYHDQYSRSTLASSVILPYVNCDTVGFLTTDHLRALAGIVGGMLSYKPFELVTVHDEFKAHANNIDHVRYQYKEILADIADSSVLNDLLSQLHGRPGTFNKTSSNLGDLIRKSEYGLC
jgi:DNA-dependent RNA polymerase